MYNCKINNEGGALHGAPLGVDLYLVELTGRFSVISSAPRSRRLVLGSDISEILSFTVSHKLREYLLSYGEKPLVIPTLAGDALILPQPFASSRLFAMVFFKQEKADALMRVAESKEFEGRVDIIGTGEVGKLSKWDAPLAERLGAVLNIADNIFNKSLITAIDDADTIVEKCKLLFGDILALTGVEVNLSIDDNVSPDDSFDAKLFSSFCLSLLMLAQRCAISGADIRIFQKGFGTSVGIAFSSNKKISRALNPDVAHFYAISDINNMIFESTFEDGRYEVSFTPARKDWSLLELKFPNELTI